MLALPIDDGLEIIHKAIHAARETYAIQKFGITGYCMGGTFACAPPVSWIELDAALHSMAIFGRSVAKLKCRHCSSPALATTGSRLRRSTA